MMMNPQIVRGALRSLSKKEDDGLSRRERRRTNRELREAEAARRDAAEAPPLPSPMPEPLAEPLVIDLPPSRLWESAKWIGIGMLGTAGAMALWWVLSWVVYGLLWALFVGWMIFTIITIAPLCGRILSVPLNRTNVSILGVGIGMGAPKEALLVAGSFSFIRNMIILFAVAMVMSIPLMMIEFLMHWLYGETILVKF